MPLTDKQREWMNTVVRMRQAKEAGVPYEGPVDPDMPADMPDHELSEQERDERRKQHGADVKRRDHPLEKTPIDEAAEGLIAGAVAGPALAGGRVLVAGGGALLAGRMAVVRGVPIALEGSVTSPAKDILKGAAKGVAGDVWASEQERDAANMRRWEAERAVQPGEQAAVDAGGPGPDEEPDQGGYTGSAPGVNGRPVGYSGNSPPVYDGTDVAGDEPAPLPVPWAVPPPVPAAAVEPDAVPPMSVEPDVPASVGPPVMSVEPAAPEEAEPPAFVGPPPDAAPPAEPPPMSVAPEAEPAAISPEPEPEPAPGQE